MLIAGGIFFGLDAFSIFKDPAGFAGAINATIEKESDDAGKHLASAIAKVGVDAVMTPLFYRTKNSNKYWKRANNQKLGRKITFTSSTIRKIKIIKRKPNQR